MDSTPAASLSRRDVEALAEARHGDPFSVLGPHGEGAGRRIRSFQPGARTVACVSGGQARPMTETAPGLFEIIDGEGAPYRLRIRWDGTEQETDDPYRFGPLLTDLDLHLFSAGRHRDLPTRLGANLRTVDGVSGVHFAVWAPNASSMSVVGDFNAWDARRHPMRRQHGAGVWEIFLPGLAAGAAYKFAGRGPHGEALPWKADPLARRTETPPRTASIVAPPPDFRWSDGDWLSSRALRQSDEAPLSFYEVHVSAWLRTQHGGYGSWDEAADRLVDYVRHMGFTHIELMPVAEHPFGGSWGYQPLSLFAPTARLGPPEAFARFVDRAHAAGIGVVLDWVPAHFPGDEHGLARFDGTALYEHADPREGFHQDWNTLIYNFGRHEVRGFLIASALWWLKAFHLDGLRVDAVASMLYRDYSRPADQWIPNVHGGRENLEAASFLQELNSVIGAEVPGAITIAEESTAWPGVTAPVHEGGLGFAFKWNMGWMHDTLRFFERDPIHRGWHLEDIRFGLVYAFSEAYVLPLSHDEVVHGKGSLLAKMPGDDWQRFANLRLLLSLMWTHPGKKLLFMGGEFGQDDEWNVDAPFPWPHDGDHRRRGLMRMVRDLNALYRAHPGLHRRDRRPDGFRWIVADDPHASVLAFLRMNAGYANDDILVVFNATPVPRHGYRIGVPHGGRWREVFNSDAGDYGGAGLGNAGSVHSEPAGWHGEPHSLTLTLPPLGLLALAFDPTA